MKRISGLVLMCLAALCAPAQSVQKADKAPAKTKGFMADFAAAKKEAAAFKQPIFAFFTGSDWCGWCMKLRSEALDTKEFEKFASDNLILFEADFPQQKKLPEPVKKQNAELAAKYRVGGYPTVFLLDAEGKVLGKTGYMAGGGQAYVKHLKELLDKVGVKTEDKPAAGKAQSPFEKMKGERAANAAQPAAQSK